MMDQSPGRQGKRMKQSRGEGRSSACHLELKPSAGDEVSHGQVLALTEGYPVGTGEFALAGRNESNATHSAAKHPSLFLWKCQQWFSTFSCHSFVPSTC